MDGWNDGQTDKMIYITIDSQIGKYIKR